MTGMCLCTLFHACKISTDLLVHLLIYSTKQIKILSPKLMMISKYYNFLSLSNSSFNQVGKKADDCR